MPAARVGALAREYLLAVQFFTRLPLSGGLARWVGFSPDLLRAGIAHWPGVGWLVAVASCGVFALLWFGLPANAFTALAAAVGATFCAVALTGALHEDGLADLADGLGGGAQRERVLAIMKDPRIGTFGATALVLVLGSRVALLALLASVSPATAVAALLAAPVVSRAVPMALVRTLDYVGDGPLAAGRARPHETAVAIGWCAVPLAIAALVQGVAFVAAGVAGCALVVAWLRSVLARRLAGYTGDALGAAQQLGELAFYLAAAAALGA